MGTKINPGNYDCYAKAQPDEPMFVLLARDPHAAEVVRYWIALRSGVAPIGYASEVPVAQRVRAAPKLREAFDCADAMEEWLKAHA